MVLLTVINNKRSKEEKAAVYDNVYTNTNGYILHLQDHGHDKASRQEQDQDHKTKIKTMTQGQTSKDQDQDHQNVVLNGFKLQDQVLRITSACIYLQLKLTI